MTIEIPFAILLALHLAPSVVVLALGIYVFHEMRPRVIWRFKTRRR